MDFLNRSNTPPLPISKDPTTIRKWWLDILHQHGKYKCYALFLCLPSDGEAIKYIVEFGDELDLISGEDCLVVSLGDTKFKLLDGVSKDTWGEMIRTQVTKGYSLAIAKLFKIDLDKFPCVIFFEDVRTSQYRIISLQKKTAEEISSEMRTIFSLFHKAIREKKKLFDVIDLFMAQQMGNMKRKEIAKIVGNMTEQTFVKAIETWIEVFIKTNA